MLAINPFHQRIGHEATCAHRSRTGADRAPRLAKTLFWDWLPAKRLVEGCAGSFVAAMQLVPISARPASTTSESIDP